MQWSNAILGFYKRLKVPAVQQLADVLYPFDDAAVWQGMQAFYQQYYADEAPRLMLVGINPGRYGAGVTGLPFTDPIRLKDACGIANPWPRKPELSSIFMYEMMEALGGVSLFFSQCYITSVSPLGFVRQGKNINYYDDRALADAIRPFSVQCMQQQLKWPVRREVCFCIGEGKNWQYLQQLNEEYGWFEKLEALPHPRFVMQYKRRNIDEYIAQYVQLLGRYGAGSASA